MTLQSPLACSDIRGGIGGQGWESRGGGGGPVCFHRGFRVGEGARKVVFLLPTTTFSKVGVFIWQPRHFPQGFSGIFPFQTPTKINNRWLS